MANNTRIYDRFEWWSVADCSCGFCINYRGKNKPCPLDACCIEDIRQEAVRREEAARNRSTGTEQMDAVSCPA